MDEQELLSCVQAFDLDALAAVYDQYSPGIYGYAFVRLGDEPLAEDCVAETFSRFLKALRARHGPREHLKAYLYRIAHNWITDHYRRQPNLQVELSDNLVSDCQPQPETQVSDRIEHQRVRLALRSLTPDQQQVITLRFVEGWEHDEIADVIQKPQGAVRALQFRALNSLRRLLLRDEEVSYVS